LHKVEFYFRTVERDGVLLVTILRPRMLDFFAVELIVLFNLGGLTSRFLFGRGVIDGQPHRVSAALRDNF